MRHRAAVVIIHEGRVLLMHRRKADRDYWVVPGGGVEEGETVEQAARREVEEETGLEVTLDRELWTRDRDGQAEHYFLAAGFHGELRLGGPEIERQSAQNVYRLEWVPLRELERIALVPDSIGARIVTVVGSE